MMNFFTKLTTKRSTRMLSFGLMALGLLTFQSCSKNNTEQPYIPPAGLMVVNASPTASTYNFYLNNQVFNTQPLPFGGPTIYRGVNPGDYTAKFTTASSTESVISKTLSLKSNQVSTLFLVGKGTTLDYYATIDDLSKTTTKAFIRLVNVSPDSQPLTLAGKDGTALITTPQVYKSASVFTEVDAKAYEFVIKTGGQPVAGGNIASTTLAAGGYYTIIAGGLITPATGDQAFTGKVITNKGTVTPQ